MNGLRTLLVVDDELDIVDLIRDFLSDSHIPVVTANNYGQALEILKTQDITAVLTDISMPGKTGLDLLHETRKMGLNIPFVFLSAHQTKEHFQDAIKLGAVDYLVKPFVPEELERVVMRLLEIGTKIKEIDSQSGPDVGKKIKVLGQLRAISRKKSA
jgi:DNA-binding NtrC family response regulator